MLKSINRNTVGAFLLGGAVVGEIVNYVWYRIAKKLNDDWYEHATKQNDEWAAFAQTSILSRVQEVSKATDESKVEA